MHAALESQLQHVPSFRGADTVCERMLDPKVYLKCKTMNRSMKEQTITHKFIDET